MLLILTIFGCMLRSRFCAHPGQAINVLHEGNASKMPNIKSAKKRMRQSAAARLRNRSDRSEFRTAVKNLRSAIEQGDPSKAQDSLKIALSVIGTSAKKGILHKNAAARHFSRLTQSVNALSTAS